jgi:hypothetical protein
MVVFQPNVVICLAVIFDDVIRCLEMFWETHVTHVASEFLGPRSLRIEVAPLPVITSTSVRVTCAVLRLCAVVPSAGPTTRQVLRMPVRMTWLDTSQNLGRRGCGPHHGELRGDRLLAGLRAA